MAKKIKVPLAVSVCPTVKDAVYVGVDQSYTGTGLVIFGIHGQLVAHTLIETKPGDRPMDKVNRITGIFQSIFAFVSEHAGDRPVCVVMEDFAYSQANQMAALGGLGWFLRIMFARAGWYFSTCPTSTLKQVATGKGNSEKEVVMMCVYKRWTFESSDNNVADAFILGKLAWMAYGKPSPDPSNGIRKGDLEGVQKLTVYR